MAAKAKLVPLYFEAANERERSEFDQQIENLKAMYGDEMEVLAPVMVGEKVPKEAHAVLFPQLIGAAFQESDKLTQINLPFVVLTSRFGTVEMWDWEIVTYLRGEGCRVFSPYSVDLAKVVLRSIAAKQTLATGGRFLMLQDSPGEGMQAYIFKRFYWWEDECTQKMKKTFGMELVYRSWKEVSENAKKII